MLQSVWIYTRLQHTWDTGETFKQRLDGTRSAVLRKLELHQSASKDVNRRESSGFGTTGATVDVAVRFQRALDKIDGRLKWYFTKGWAV
jgi:hypothetical protein